VVYLSNSDKKESGEVDSVKEVQISELRKKIQLMNKDIPILKSGKDGAIELNPENPSHRDWYSLIVTQF